MHFPRWPRATGSSNTFLTVLGDEARAQADAVDATVAPGKTPVLWRVCPWR